MRRPVTSVLLVVVVLLGGASTPVTAAAPARYCMTVVDRVAGTSETRVVDRICSTTAQPGTHLPRGVTARGANRATMSAKAAKLPGVTVDLLVTFFEHTDYRGRWDTVGGRYGTCDYEGTH